jgi:hypothetical protein
MWAEPFNALSNAAFILAAILAFRAMRGVNIRHFPDGYALCAVLCCIGVGSGLWHFMPTPVTIAMDVIPITVFIHLYLVAFLRRGFGWRWGGVALGFATLQALNGAVALWFNPDTLHGTILYLPTYAVLIAMVGYAKSKSHPHTRALATITMLWTVSLICRTVDLPLCMVFPLGTHFLWHAMNAVVLYRLLIVLVKVQRE